MTKDYFNKKVVDNFKASLVEDATFTPNEEYPILKSEFISDEIPKKIIMFVSIVQMKLLIRRILIQRSILNILVHLEE